MRWWRRTRGWRRTWRTWRIRGWRKWWRRTWRMWRIRGWRRRWRWWYIIVYTVELKGAEILNIITCQ
jgi:hypothetical protein